MRDSLRASRKLRISPHNQLIINFMEIQIISFEGFYNSIHSYNLDSTIEYMCESDEDNEGKDPYEVIDFSESCVEYAKDYVHKLNETIEDRDINLEFKELVSPKFYNYSTDKIFCHATQEVIKKLYNNALKNITTFEHVIEENFTPYSGFIPYYSNDIDEWLGRDYCKFDSVECGILLEVYIDSMNLREEINNNVLYNMNVGELLSWK